MLDKFRPHYWYLYFFGASAAFVDVDYERDGKQKTEVDPLALHMVSACVGRGLLVGALSPRVWTQRVRHKIQRMNKQTVNYASLQIMNIPHLLVHLAEHAKGLPDGCD